MHKLGISVYPEKENIKETYEYIKLASKYGFSRIFTCLLSVDKPCEEIIETFTDFIDFAHAHNFTVAVDTNPNVFKHLNASYNNLTPFYEMGVDIIRLDGSFGAIEDVEITHNPYHIKIEFNGSFNKGVDLLIKNGANKNNICICHNFYPERYSGLDWDHFINMNKLWKSLNLRTAAFITSQEEHTHGPWNVFCGLPSVEFMRNLPVDLQARYYLATHLIDDIIIGNAYASEEELSSLAQLNLEAIELDLIEENISPEEAKIVYDYNPHFDRYDYSSYFIRSSFPRLNYKDISIPYRKYDQPYFHKGDVLIVNDNLSHYRGELEIVLQDIVNDGERNCVGHIPQEELLLLDLIKPGYHFAFKKPQK